MSMSEIELDDAEAEQRADDQGQELDERITARRWQQSHPHRHRSPRRLLTSAEVLAALDGAITYRQLDYWVRTGKIVPSRHASGPGSGSVRGWTEAEVLALGRVIEDLGAAHAVIASFDSGNLWRSHMAGTA